MEVGEEKEIREEDGLSVQQQFRSLLAEEMDIANTTDSTQILKVSGSREIEVCVNPEKRAMTVVGYDSSEKPPNNCIDGREELLDRFEGAEVLRVEKIGG